MNSKLLAYRDPLLLLLAWLGKRVWNSDWRKDAWEGIKDKWNTRPIEPYMGYYTPAYPSTTPINAGETAKLEGMLSRYLGGENDPYDGSGRVITRGGVYTKSNSKDPTEAPKFWGAGSMRPNEVEVAPPSWFHDPAEYKGDELETPTPGGVRRRGPLVQYGVPGSIALMLAPWLNDPGAGPFPPGGERPGGPPGGGDDEPGEEEPWVVTPTELPQYTPLAGGPSFLGWQPGNTGLPIFTTGLPFKDPEED